MLLAGKFAGEAFERLGQPAVMGELLAGIALGAGFLKVIPIGAADPLTPVFQLLAQVGVVVLLFEIGLETDLKAMMRRSEEHTSELQSQSNLVCRLLLEKKKTNILHSCH